MILGKEDYEKDTEKDGSADYSPQEYTAFDTDSFCFGGGASGGAGAGSSF